MDSDARRLYIAWQDHVAVVDVYSGTLAGNISELKGVHGIALAPDLGRGFTTNGGDQSSTIVDLKTLQKIGTVKTVGKNPDSMAYDSFTKRVFIMNVDSNDATAINAASGAVAGTIALGGQAQSPIADGKGNVFVNMADKGQIVEVDAHNLTVTHTWPLAPCEGPSGLSMDQNNRRLFAVCDDRIMAVSVPAPLDLKTSWVLGSKNHMHEGKYRRTEDHDALLLFGDKRCGFQGSYGVDQLRFLAKTLRG